MNYPVLKIFTNSRIKEGFNGAPIQFTDCSIQTEDFPFGSALHTGSVNNQELILTQISPAGETDYT